MTFHRHLHAKQDPYLFGAQNPALKVPAPPFLASPLKTDIAECTLCIHTGGPLTVEVLPPARVIIEAVGAAGFTVARPTANGLVGPNSAGYLPFVYAEGRCVMKGVTPILYAPWALRAEAVAFMRERYVEHLRAEVGMIDRLIEQVAVRVAANPSDPGGEANYGMKIVVSEEELQRQRREQTLPPGAFPIAALPKGWG